MADTQINDIPGGGGMATVMTVPIVAMASNGSDTAYQHICKVSRAGSLAAAYITLSASLASNTGYRNFQIVNNGSLGVATTIMASTSRLGSLSIAANIPVSIPLSSTAANYTFVAGDSIAFNTTSTGDGEATIAADTGILQIQFA